MATLYTHQSSNIAKTWLFMSFFFVLIVILGWLLSYRFNSPIILYIAVIFSLVQNWIAYFYSDKIALSSTGAILADSREYLELHRIVENLAITAGLPKPRVYIINDPAPNAFATGRNKNNSAVAVTSGLLQILNRTELEGVIAHELAHIGNKDILLSTVAVSLVGIISVVADLFLRIGAFGGRDERNSLGVLAIVGIILMPIVAFLIQMAISRKREFLADSTGALMTRYPEGLASALLKISEFTNPMQKANSATAHLFISNPFGGGKMLKGIQKILSTHPPVEERVSLLRGYGVK
jgi:heat shock protein HtpX